MKLSDYYNFEFPMYPYFNSAYGDHIVREKYRGEWINGNWYIKYLLKGNSPALVPKDSWIIPGRRYLKWILENDPEFTDYLYIISIKLISFTKKLAEMNYEDYRRNKARSRDEFYNEYISTWSPVIGFSYPLDMALDEYLKTHPIDPHSIPCFGNSFIREEEKELQMISKENDKKKREQRLEDHAAKYSFVLSNYTGYYPVSSNYFKSHLEEIKNKHIEVEKILPLIKPQNIREWIGFMTYIRDVRKQCNMTYNAMADRYLRDECEKLQLSHNDAVLLTPEEFEAQKNEGLRTFNGIRFMEVTNYGQIDLDPKVWDSLIIEKESGEVQGSVASKGKARGRVNIIFGKEDFGAMKKGDVLVTSMTRPDFAPILPLAAAIVTNEGGVTCHAAIISREMKIPCIIGTGNATKILKTGDMVEVDADKGIVRILS